MAQPLYKVAACSEGDPELSGGVDPAGAPGADFASAPGAAVGSREARRQRGCSTRSALAATVVAAALVACAAFYGAGHSQQDITIHHEVEELTLVNESAGEDNSTDAADDDDGSEVADDDDDDDAADAADDDDDENDDEDDEDDDEDSADTDDRKASADDGKDGDEKKEDKKVDKKEDKKKGDKPLPKETPDMGKGFPTGTFWPTLFCFSVMNAANPGEIALIKGQVRNRTGIVACDNFAVLSGEKKYLGRGHRGPDGKRVKVYSWVNPASPVPMGNLQGGDETNSFKNTQIFINAWNILVKSGAVFGHNWTVKVDPDAVFFAERLRWHLKTHMEGGGGKYFKNCNFKGPQLYGSLEVFNEASMYAYKQNGGTCASQLPWGGWGEDEWIDKCMSQKLQAQPISDFELVGDHRCMSAECEDTWRAAFHDYKSEALYYNCWKRSMDAVKWKAKEEERKKKMKQGGYFCCVSATDPGNACNTCQPTSKKLPDKDFCGGSDWACKKCGAQAAWCRKAKKEGFELAWGK